MEWERKVGTMSHAQASCFHELVVCPKRDSPTATETSTFMAPLKVAFLDQAFTDHILSIGIPKLLYCLSQAVPFLFIPTVIEDTYLISMEKYTHIFNLLLKQGAAKRRAPRRDL